jgi:hypothetical protein
MRKGLAVLAVAGAAMLVWLGAASASTATQGQLFFNGGVVGTVVVPSPLPNGGIDPFFKVTNGVSGQLGIAGAAPGTPGYHGGAWAVSLVTFHTGFVPHLLTSAQAVHSAETAGEVDVTRDPAADFRCPVVQS